MPWQHFRNEEVIDSGLGWGGGAHTGRGGPCGEPGQLRAGLLPLLGRSCRAQSVRCPGVRPDWGGEGRGVILGPQAAGALGRIWRLEAN